MSTLAKWCTRGKRTVLGIWIAVLAALAVLALSHGTAFTDSAELPDSESATAYSLTDTGGEPTTSGNVVWRGDRTAMLAEIKTVPGVRSVSAPIENSELQTTYARVTLAEDTDTGPIKAIADRNGAQLGGQAFTGQPGASHGTEAIGILAALVILMLMFRSFWAALLPILTGLVGVGTSLLVVVLASHVMDLAATSLTMGALIGLGVGIDYALFIVNRHRKALQDGASVADGITGALTTSGRAVVLAGATVVVALLGMFVVNLGILTGMAQAAAVTVVFTVLAAVTLLPALLALLGTRILGRSRRHLRPGFGARWADLVDRAPRRAVVLSLLVVALLAAPVTAMRIGDADASSDPVGSAGRSYAEMMPAGADATLLLVARPADAARLTALAPELTAMPGVASVTPAGRNVLAIVPTTSAQTEETADLVERLRDRTPGLYVGGATATAIDMSDALMSKLPLYLGLIALLGFLLLAAELRSLLIPLVGAVTNLATIGVGLGVITAIFQFGWGTELLGVGEAAPIMYIVPVLIVGVMFGLSMDYQVFLVSRMHEEWGRTRDNRASIRAGVADTFQVIAVAATIMLCVFASFGFSGQRIVAGIGIGMAAAVVVDAFVVRLTLIPALMRLIGDANWWFPGRRRTVEIKERTMVG
ncbi:MAG TPA: MMPL family transporter [Actinoplanes sp.]|nr:MMPL family transporter [Actinoplanes sp.]